MAKPYITAGIESDLHSQITKEAARNKQSFSAQIREYLEKSFVFEEKAGLLAEDCKNLQEKVNELKEEIRKITDVN